MNKTILAAVVLIAAAFAGVMIVGDDTDADTPTSYTITYKGELGIVTQTGVDTISLKGPDDVSSIIEYDNAVYKFIGWKTESANPVVYKFVTGASGEEGPSISLSENMTLVPAYELKADAAVVFFKLDDTTFMVKTSESKVNLGSTADDVKALLAAIKVKEDAGFKFDGYFTQGSEPAVVPVGDDNIMTVTDRATYDVKMHMAYEVKYVVEGTTILTVEDAVTIKLSPVKDIPVAPSKANFGFVAWADETGKEIITYTVDGGYKAVPADSELVFTADTILYAKFVPANMTVTFEVGEFKSTQTVLYGEKAMKPELPAGYIAWMFGEKEFDFNTPITENITIVALEGEPVSTYYVTFISEGVKIGGPYDSAKVFTIPNDPVIEGKKFVGWFVGTFKVTDIAAYVADHPAEDIEFVASFTEADPIVPEKDPFYKTPMGQCAIIIAVFIVGLFFFGVFTGRIELPKFKVSRVGKDEVVEQVQEEKKP